MFAEVVEIGSELVEFADYCGHAAREKDRTWNRGSGLFVIAAAVGMQTGQFQFRNRLQILVSKSIPILTLDRVDSDSKLVNRFRFREKIHL